MDTRLVGPSLLKSSVTEKTQDLKKSDRAENRALAKSKSSAAGRGKQDFNVQLSSEARELAEARQKAFDIARNTPEVREDKVQELKEKIKSGEYKVSSEKIADGILREALMEKLAAGPKNDI